MALDPDLPQLIYGGNYERPERESYTFTNPDGSRRTETEGGPMLLQQDHLGGPFTVSVEYVADTPMRVAFFQNFYLRQTLEGSIPFQCALALETAEVYTDYVCRFTGAPTWNNMTGIHGRISYSLEVERREPDYEYDDTIFWLYQEYGDDAWFVLNELYILTNPTMNQWIPD